MPVKDLKQEKTVLRERFRQLRRQMTPEQKLDCDRRILERITTLYQYPKARTILTYVSKEIEVDTLLLIERALSDGKCVAVPKCIESTREMEFYVIHSLSDLEPGYFGVQEPKVPPCRKLRDPENSICIVPGMAFDFKGFRLGYGKGFYDRFLSDYPGVTVGLCYSSCVQWSLPIGKYDRPVDMVVTEKYFRKTRKSDP